MLPVGPLRHSKRVVPWSHGARHRVGGTFHEDEDEDKIDNNIIIIIIIINNNNKAVATMICNRQFAAASVLEKLAALNLKSS